MLFEDWSEYLFNKIYNKFGDDIFDLGICTNKNLNWNFFEKYNKKWNYEQMSYNPNITIEIVNNNLLKNWNKDALKINFGRNSKIFFKNNYYFNYDISLELFETYKNIIYYEEKYNYKINYNILSENPNITWETIIQNKDKKWNYNNLLIYNKNINLDIILNNLNLFKDHIHNISLNKSINWKDINNHPEIKWNYYDLSSNPNITIENVINNLDKNWSFNKLSSNPSITMDIIKKYNIFNWNIINYYRNPNFNLFDLENIQLFNNLDNKKQIIKNICLNSFDKDREDYCKINKINIPFNLKNINMFDICYI